jgi:eukaryotic-like serine/threonine-protein kinase
VNGELDHDNFSPGQSFGRYVLIHRVGRGGMGDVWKARLTSGGGGVTTYFAVKVLRQSVGSSRALTMQMDEARVISMIRGIHVARLVEVITQQNAVALVMEWVDGVPVSRALAQLGTFPLGIALRIASDACTGLHAAHELTDENGSTLDVVHRDVSPQNLMVDREGATRVIDFGIARFRGRTTPETRSGVSGKVRYMSREHASGEVVDRRTDVFALGVVLYEMLSGELPFGKRSDVQILRALVSAVPPLALPSQIPSPIRTLVNRALSHNREKRFSTSLLMREAIESAMRECDLVTDGANVAEFVRPIRTLAMATQETAAQQIAPENTVVIPTPSIAPAQDGRTMRLQLESQTQAPMPQQKSAPSRWVVTVAVAAVVALLIISAIALHR